MPDDGFAGLSSSSVASAAPPELINERLEQSLLGALMVDPKMLEDLPPSFSPTHYAFDDHAEIHRAIIAVGNPGNPVAVEVMKAIALGNPEKKSYIAAVLASFVGRSTVAPYAAEVTDLYRRRCAVTLAEQLRASALQPAFTAPIGATLAQAASEIDEIVGSGIQGRPHVSLIDAVDAAIEAGELARASGGAPSGIGTGLPSLDKAIGGMEPGALYILAGRPSMGKSGLGLQIALDAARHKHGVLVVSLEMQAMQLGRRALALQANIPLSLLKYGNWDPRAGEDIVLARKAMHDLSLSIEDQGGLNTQMITLKARAARRRHGLGLIVVDHVHIVAAPAESTRMGATWAVSQVSNALKRLAKEMEVPVLALAQLNRAVEGRDDKRPTMADLRQSGELEQDAEAIMLLYRPEYYLSRSEPEQTQFEPAEKWQARVTAWRDAKDRLAGKAEVSMPKVRDGEPCTVNLRFDGSRTCFMEVGPYG